MDYLKKACREQGINLIYTNSSYNILSSEVANYAPTLHAYRRLSECPEDVAQCIVKYYVTKEDQYLKTVENYLEDSLFVLGYTISPPNKEFLTVSRSHRVSYIKERDMPKEKDDFPGSMELDILSITCVDSDGKTYQIKPGATVTSPAEDIREVDIVVENE